MYTSCKRSTQSMLIALLISTLAGCGSGEDFSELLEKGEKAEEANESLTPAPAPTSPTQPTGSSSVVPTPMSPTPAPTAGEIGSSLTVPLAPSNLRGNRQGRVISLTWTDNADNESGFSIEIRHPNGNWQAISVANSNATFAHVYALEQTSAYLRVKAVNAAGNSEYSNELELTLNTAVNTALIAEGETLWTEKGCASCHTPADKPDEVADQRITDGLAKADIASIIETTMPYGSAALCDKACSEAITAWLYSVYPDITPVQEEEGEAPVVVPDTAPDKASLLKSLHKASLSLGFEQPRESWEKLVNSKSEAGLEAVVREIMEEDNFYIRLREIYAPDLQGLDTPSNRYASSMGGEVHWFNDYKGMDEDNETARYARKEIINAINNEPLQLIEHVVRNDLPFTEILTADYTLVNYYSARSYNKLDDITFKKVSNPENEHLPYDSGEFKKAKLPVPTAGILTSSAFITRYPTSNGNLNRHRSYTVYKLFLDTDILEIPGSRVQADDITVDNPTLNNPVCQGCHLIMDPVSSSFRHWQSGEFREDEWEKNWDQETILPPGFNGTTMPEGHEAPLQWLAEQIVKDPRFALSTVKTLFSEITGHPLLPTPNENSSEVEAWLYDYQQEQLQGFAEDFISSGYNVKELIVDFVMSDYFRNEEYLGGTKKLLSASQLTRKVYATFGIDNVAKVERLLTSDYYTGDQPNGVMSLIQRLTGSEAACFSVHPDISKSPQRRLLLPYFNKGRAVNDKGLVTSPEKATEIKENLRHLMWAIWGLKVELDSPELLSLYEAYLKLANAGVDWIERTGAETYEYRCDSENIQKGNDPYYAARAWMGIVNLMIDDFRFLYD